MMTTTDGAYCPTAMALVPIYPAERCEWCGKTHEVTHAWRGSRWVERVA